MLSGKAPFLSESSEWASDVIVNRIKLGSFDLSGPEWNLISSQAKNIIKG